MAAAGAGAARATLTPPTAPAVGPGRRRTDDRTRRPALASQLPNLPGLPNLPSLDELRTLRQLPDRQTSNEKRLDQLEAQVRDLYDQVREVREHSIGLEPHLERLNTQVPDVYQRLAELRKDLAEQGLRAISHVDDRVGDLAARMDLLTEKVHDLRDSLAENLARLDLLDELGVDVEELRDDLLGMRAVLDRRLAADVEAAEATGRFLRSMASRLEQLEQQAGSGRSPKAPRPQAGGTPRPQAGGAPRPQAGGGPARRAGAAAGSAPEPPSE